VSPIQTRELKGKAVPLHAMEALGGRGGIAPTHSRPQTRELHKLIRELYRKKDRQLRKKMLRGWGVKQKKRKQGGHEVEGYYLCLYVKVLHRE
jgi:hypothetical protein